MIDENKEIYLDNIRSLNFYEEAVRELRLEDADDEEITNVVNGIIQLFKHELMLRRKEMVQMYGCITSYIQAIDDIKEDYDSYESDDADKAIESFIENINRLFCDIENSGLELESFKEGIEFCNYLLRAKDVKITNDDIKEIDINNNINK